MVTSSDQDDVITDLINSAVQYHEQGLNFIVDTDDTIYQYYDRFDGEELQIWHKYISDSAANVAVHYWDGSAWTEFSNSNYRVDAASNPPRILLKDGSDWPDLTNADLNAVRVSFKIDTSVSFYKDLKASVMTLVAARYENREGMVVPESVKSFIDLHRMPS